MCLIHDIYGTCIAKMKFLCEGVQKLYAEQTETQIDTQTDMTENITYPHTQVVNICLNGQEKSYSMWGICGGKLTYQYNDHKITAVQFFISAAYQNPTEIVLILSTNVYVVFTILN